MKRLPDAHEFRLGMSAPSATPAAPATQVSGVIPPCNVHHLYGPVAHDAKFMPLKAWLFGIIVTAMLFGGMVYQSGVYAESIAAIVGRAVAFAMLPHFG